jgi:hypothetical protein
VPAAEWSGMTEAEIIAALLAFIDRGPADDDAFGRMALTVFAYQFAHNEPYRAFARNRGLTPRTVRAWRDIPALPIQGFKDHTLTCRPVDEVPHIFMTSGTTGSVRGRSYHPSFEVWDRSMLRNFAAGFMAKRETIRMGILFPDEAAMPNSSLARYLALALRTFGAEGSANYMTASGLDVPGLLADLEDAETGGEPFALLGASYSLVHLMDALDSLGRRVALPEGSRILDTGGFKGQSREVAPDAFYGRLEALFGVPRFQCINMYGMTELSTQFYDRGNAVSPSVKSGPHWIRTRAVDPATGRDTPPGTVGVLVHHDLAHFNSVSAILTEDLGAIVDGGFLLLGRATGAEARGCSMAVEDFLRGPGRA